MYLFLYPKFNSVYVFRISEIWTIHIYAIRFIHALENHERFQIESRFMALGMMKAG